MNSNEIGINNCQEKRAKANKINHLRIQFQK